MRGIKKLNNNFALCKDSAGVEVIAYGRGVGFGKFPCEIPLKNLEAVYYNVTPQVIPLLSTMREDVFCVATAIVDYARDTLRKPVPENLVFSLSDHIQFAIERQEKGIPVKVPLAYEVEHLYEEEYAVGKYAVKKIQRELHVRLPRDEIAGIALHFINNYQNYDDTEDAVEFGRMQETLLKIIDDEMNVSINRDSYDCYRFITHMKYFVKRADNQELYGGNGEDGLYTHMKQEYPKIFSCMQKIVEYLQPLLDIQCSEEEQLYLMIHINRLCVKEDCHR